MMIDQNQLLKMKNAGLTNRKIAKKLGVSTKTVQRACKKFGIVKRGENNTELEQFMRDLFLELGESGGKVAERFGVSRQAVLK